MFLKNTGIIFISLLSIVLVERSHSDSEQLEVKELNGVQKLTCDDIDLSKRRKKKMIPLDQTDINVEIKINQNNSLDMIKANNSLVIIDGDKMKSINEGLNIVGQENDIVDNKLNEVVNEIKSDGTKPVPEADELCEDFSLAIWNRSPENQETMTDFSPSDDIVLESHLPVDSDVETKDGSNETVLDNFNDHGVISLHYPEEDGNQVNFEHTEQKKQVTFQYSIVHCL